MALTTTDRRMTVDQQLYEILDVPEEASQDQIGKAYKRALLETHPDKAPKDEHSQRDAAERFCTVQRAFDILSNEDTRKRYDEDGLDAVITKPGELERATKAFETFHRRDNDTHQKELLAWWSNPGTSALDAYESLRVPKGDYLAALKALYEQFRLTHGDTTGGDPLSKVASDAILKMALDHFGEGNASRLKGWNSNDNLDPFLNGKYLLPTGEWVAPEPEETSQALLALQKFHLLYTHQFKALLDAPGSHQKASLQGLQAHTKHYKELRQSLEEQSLTPADAKLLNRVSKTIEWSKIAAEFRRRQKLKGASTTEIKKAENTWKTCVISYALPDQWDQLVLERFQQTSQVRYQQSSFNPHPTGGVSTAGEDTLAETQNTAPDVERNFANSRRGAEPLEQPVASEDRGVLPDAGLPAPATTVRDGGVEREVFAFRDLGSSSQLFLKMSPPDAPFELYDIVSGKMFRRSVQHIREQDELNFARMKGRKADLQEKDFSDLDWFGIATQRRGPEPTGGWATQPQTHLLCRDAGVVKAFTRTDMGSVFGKADVDVHIQTQRIAAGGQRALPAPPTRKSKAIRYDLGADDLEFTTTHPDDAPRLLEQGIQQEQYENDKMMEELVALSRSARISDDAQGNKQNLGGNAHPPQSTDGEALKMMAQALAMLRQGRKTEVYG